MTGTLSNQSSSSGEDSEYLTVDHLHQFAYCPRRAYLMHVEGLWASNEFTEDGRRVHKRVDRIAHVLPTPETEQEADVIGSHSPPSGQGDDPPQISRSVSISCSKMGLTGKLDLVSTAGDEASPVETKRGKVPNVPGGAWEPEKVQLMAQGLLLRANGFRCDHGFLYYAGSRRRVEVPFAEELETRTVDLLRQAQNQAKDQILPDPLDDSPKCKGCSLSGLCLPDETLALRHVPADPVAAKVRRLYPPRDDASPLYIQEQGAWVGTRQGLLTVKKDDEVVAEARLKDVDHVVLCGNVQIGTQAVHLLCEAGIPVVHLSTGHWFYAITHGMGLRNAYDRAAQFIAAQDVGKCLSYAKAVVSAKGANQRTMLRRNAEPEPGVALAAMASVLEHVGSASDAESLLGVEGSLARAYFGEFALMLKQGDLAERFQIEGRSRRPPPDPVNSLLSFGYALLAKECTVALLAVGLDPWWGLYHKPRHGRPALALDLMEEFRPLVVDSAVLTAVNTGMLARQDFVIGHNGCMLKDTGRKAFIRAYEARCDQIVTHPTLGYRVSWRVMIRLQARLLARWLRGDLPIYSGVTTR